MKTLVPCVAEWARELATFAVPETLIHGDLHSGNIHAEGPLFFDWSDGAVAHPFFDLKPFFGRYKRVLQPGDADADRQRARRLNAYLEPWMAFEPMDRLRTAFALSEKLAAVYHALSYYWIVQHSEETAMWELGGAIPSFLRDVLAAGEEQRPVPGRGCPYRAVGNSAHGGFSLSHSPSETGVRRGRRRPGRLPGR